MKTKIKNKKTGIIIILSAVLLMFTLTFSSCKKENTDENFTIDLNEVLTKIHEFMPPEILIETSSEYISSVYGISTERINKLIAYKTINMNSADEIIMIEVSNTDNKEDDKDYLKETVTRLESIKISKMNEFEDYVNNPDHQKEYLQIKDAEIYQKGRYIIFIISDYTNEINDIVKQYLD